MIDKTREIALKTLYKINEEEGSLLISKLGLNIEDGFKFEDTIYQKELIKCQ